MRRGVGEAEAEGRVGVKGRGSRRYWWRARAAVMKARGRVDASVERVNGGGGEERGMGWEPSKVVFLGMWKVVWDQARAYSAKLPPGVFISWNAATLSPGLNSVMEEPTAWIVPAISSPGLEGGKPILCTVW